MMLLAKLRDWYSSLRAEERHAESIQRIHRGDPESESDALNDLQLIATRLEHYDEVRGGGNGKELEYAIARLQCFYNHNYPPAGKATAISLLRVVLKSLNPASVAREIKSANPTGYSVQTGRLSLANFQEVAEFIEINARELVDKEVMHAGKLSIPDLDWDSGKFRDSCSDIAIAPEEAFPRLWGAIRWAGTPEQKVLQVGIKISVILGLLAVILLGRWASLGTAQRPASIVWLIPGFLSLLILEIFLNGMTYWICSRTLTPYELPKAKVASKAATAIAGLCALQLGIGLTMSRSTRLSVAFAFIAYSFILAITFLSEYIVGVAEVRLKDLSQFPAQDEI